MSKIVLCETKPAKTAYTIHKINRSFQSYEELCWLLEHYLIFFLSEGIDRSLKNYLKVLPTDHGGKTMGREQR